MKTCTKCKLEKPLSDFGKHGSGFRNNCKPCHSALAREYREKNPEKVKAARKSYYDKNRDTLLAGRAEHRRANLDKYKTREKEYRQKNSEKRCAYTRGYRLNNPEKVKAAQKAWREKNTEYLISKRKAYREGNLGKIKEYLVQNRERIRPRKAANQRDREARKLKATPNWSNLKKIRALYEARDRISKCLGIEMHVDHIIPLKNPKVCGLHVFENLQIITAKDNVSKNNKFEPDLC